MRVVGEPEVMCQACEVFLALADAVECQADPQPVPVLADGAAGDPGEDAAEMAGRAAHRPAEPHQAQPRVGGQGGLGLIGQALARHGANSLAASIGSAG